MLLRESAVTLATCILLSCTSTDSQKQEDQPNATIKINKKSVTTSGDGMAFGYSYSYKVVNGVYVVEFRKPIERDDATVTGVILDLINQHFGKHRVLDLTPRLVNVRGFNMILFEAGPKDFLILPIKDDYTGEVVELELWME